MIRFYNEDITYSIKNKRIIKKWITEIINNHNFGVGDINIIFTSDENLLKINKTYLNHNYYTDIITFNYNSKNIISGDLYISINRVQENYIEYSQSFIDKLLRVIIHGILHLLCFNDKTDTQKKIMREKENNSLKQLEKYNIKW